MKSSTKICLWVSVAILLVAGAQAQQPAKASSSGDLERVLDQMDVAAAKFRTTQASFVWDQYQRVIDETDTQKGRIYFRRSGDSIDMAADVGEPDAKYVVVADGKIQLYQPRIDQVTVYSAGKNKEEFESFLVLGFGGGGHQLLNSFDVKYLGPETLDGVKTEKLDLVPKSQKIRNTFSHIVLWIDPARGISVQQKLFDPSGDYRLAKYSDIQVNQRLPDGVFKIKTTGKTKILSPQG